MFKEIIEKATIQILRETIEKEVTKGQSINEVVKKVVREIIEEEVALEKRNIQNIVSDIVRSGKIQILVNHER